MESFNNCQRSHRELEKKEPMITLTIQKVGIGLKSEHLILSEQNPRMTIVRSPVLYPYAGTPTLNPAKRKTIVTTMPSPSTTATVDSGDSGVLVSGESWFVGGCGVRAWNISVTVGGPMGNWERRNR
jgi:hypothetical protein